MNAKDERRDWSSDLLLFHLQNLHLKTTVRGGSVRHLQSLHKCFCELLHHWEYQSFGCTLQVKRFYNFRNSPFTRSPNGF